MHSQAGREDPARNRVPRGGPGDEALLQELGITPAFFAVNGNSSSTMDQTETSRLAGLSSGASASSSSSSSSAANKKGVFLQQTAAFFAQGKAGKASSKVSLGAATQASRRSRGLELSQGVRVKGVNPKEHQIFVDEHGILRHHHPKNRQGKAVSRCLVRVVLSGGNTKLGPAGGGQQVKCLSSTCRKSWNFLTGVEGGQASQDGIGICGEGLVQRSIAEGGGAVNGVVEPPGASKMAEGGGENDRRGSGTAGGGSQGGLGSGGTGGPASSSAPSSFRPAAGPPTAAAAAAAAAALVSGSSSRGSFRLRKLVPGGGSVGGSYGNGAARPPSLLEHGTFFREVALLWMATPALTEPLITAVVTPGLSSLGILSGTQREREGMGPGGSSGVSSVGGQVAAGGGSASSSSSSTGGPSPLSPLFAVGGSCLVLVPCSSCLAIGIPRVDCSCPACGFYLPAQSGFLTHCLFSGIPLAPGFLPDPSKLPVPLALTPTSQQEQGEGKGRGQTMQSQAGSGNAEGREGSEAADGRRETERRVRTRTESPPPSPAISGALSGFASSVGQEGQVFALAGQVADSRVYGLLFIKPTEVPPEGSDLCVCVKTELPHDVVPHVEVLLVAGGEFISLKPSGIRKQRELRVSVPALPAGDFDVRIRIGGRILHGTIPLAVRSKVQETDGDGHGEGDGGFGETSLSLPSRGGAGDLGASPFGLSLSASARRLSDVREAPGAGGGGEGEMESGEGEEKQEDDREMAMPTPLPVSHSSPFPSVSTSPEKVPPDAVVEGEEKYDNGRSLESQPSVEGEMGGEGGRATPPRVQIPFNEMNADSEAHVPPPTRIPHDFSPASSSFCHLSPEEGTLGVFGVSGGKSRARTDGTGGGGRGGMFLSPTVPGAPRVPSSLASRKALALQAAAGGGGMVSSLQGKDLVLPLPLPLLPGTGGGGVPLSAVSAGVPHGGFSAPPSSFGGAAETQDLGGRESEEKERRQEEPGEGGVGESGAVKKKGKSKGKRGGKSEELRGRDVWADEAEVEHTGGSTAMEDKEDVPMEDRKNRRRRSRSPSSAVKEKEVRKEEKEEERDWGARGENEGRWAQKEEEEGEHNVNVEADDDDCWPESPVPVPPGGGTH
uniref:Uncharacterized protein n=1 Tax=Chromera velia CCMP2878 TaxID=1169474 RepID=A0A0G4HJ12_9ALVE|eukprot:Cvel_28123.t1-p1 / transcript=Cvel_28123.t1 / gene=Cvel_28123 / organism=Chromera_velia_CCMP2878 / gene_product=hypothetical protein / transcript_product=hypothetical protein / location=Cvel_scaffold3626:3356-9190(-) / protein_length=1118 / sequence_SO=supercontig / SO=protein_coding / is_pseudo=false